MRLEAHLTTTDVQMKADQRIHQPQLLSCMHYDPSPLSADNCCSAWPERRHVFVGH